MIRSKSGYSLKLICISAAVVIVLVYAFSLDYVRKERISVFCSAKDKTEYKVDLNGGFLSNCNVSNIRDSIPIRNYHVFDGWTTERDTGIVSATWRKYTVKDELKKMSSVTVDDEVGAYLQIPTGYVSKKIPNSLGSYTPESHNGNEYMTPAMMYGSDAFGQHANHGQFGDLNNKTWKPGDIVTLYRKDHLETYTIVGSVDVANGGVNLALRLRGIPVAQYDKEDQPLIYQKSIATCKWSENDAKTDEYIRITGRKPSNSGAFSTETLFVLKKVA